MEDFHPRPEKGSHPLPEEAADPHPAAADRESVDGSEGRPPIPVGVPHGDELVGVHMDSPLPDD
ncbi:MAG: hypothetical protein QW831_08880, partial [Candidatus Jordarchaeaceae archaeon]